MHINTLKLTTFRNFESLDLQTEGKSHVVLYGENGAGKTNILEALSLLSPGFGIHKAKRAEQVQDGSLSWGLYSELTGGEESFSLGMSYDGKDRKIMLDGDIVEHQTDLTRLGHIVWFTPRYDRLFHDGAAPRRDFFDRLVFGLYPNHGALINRYKTHIKNRLKLLKENADSDWIGAEEHMASELAYQIAINRKNYFEALAETLSLVELELECPLHKFILEGMGATDIASKWQSHRKRDSIYQSTHFGTHRTDVVGTFLPAGNRLNRTSTGQHKKALLDVLLAHAELLHKQKGNAPLILLDEFVAHLDAENKNMMLEALTKYGAQIWMTGTEKAAFENISDALFCKVENGTLTLD
ncbi:MAG: AAA family ATPase [Pseudomonadota bacterium]|nr:AAA family ATPase [Pseudomonadota bacterium]